MAGAPFTECVPPGRSGPHPESCQDPPRTRGGRTLRALNRRAGNRAHVDRRRLGQDRTADLARGSGKARGALITGRWRPTESDHAGKKAAHYLKRCAGPPGRYNCTMLQALRAQDALAIAEVSRRRSRAAFARRSTRADSADLAGTAAVIELRGRLAAHAPHPTGGAARISHGHTARTLYRRGAS